MIVSILTFIISGSFGATNVTSENIKTLLEKKNTKVMAADLGTSAASERDGHLIRSFMPTIEVYGAEEAFKLGTQKTKNQPAYGAEARVNLFNGGRDRDLNQINKLEVQKRK